MSLILIESDERTNLSVERGEAEGNMGAGEDRRPLKGRNRGRARAAYLPPATPQPLPAPLPTALLSLHVIAIIIIHAFHSDSELGQSTKRAVHISYQPIWGVFHPKIPHQWK